jgi:cytochrome c553
MFRRARPRPTLLLRLLMLVVVGVGVFGSSLASALADIHLTVHADSSELHGTGDDTAGVASSDGDGNEDWLHALVHCGHCHGHGGVLPMAAMAWSLPTAPSHGVPAGLVAQLRTQPPENLLRPPIAI